MGSDRAGQRGRATARRFAVVALVAAFAAALPAAARADLADEEALAAKYAPVVRLVEQEEECGPGEPYIPTDVELLFGSPRSRCAAPGARATW